ncbi:MAG: DUF3999 family protein [Acidobacteria bacterium]|nr:DUF3999 family protein [Acidobacteriota bacterium]
MKRRMPLVLFVCINLGAGVRAQGPEPLTGWPYFKEVQAVPGQADVLSFTLDTQALDQSRLDHADLRLYDGGGREIPYALRIRREIEASEAFPAREFNRSMEGDVAQVFYDLGEQPQQHNEAEIDTPGENFRRLVDIEGSSDGAQWSTLVSGAAIFRFASGGRDVEQKAVPYPVSRYRYVRIRVHRDPPVDRAAPQIKVVKIRKSIRQRAEILDFPARIEGREASRSEGRPASAWRLGLGGRIPFEKLFLTSQEASFSRPFRLEVVDDPSSPVLLASGELFRREEPGYPQPTVAFAERFARHLKLTVTDDRNPPLAIITVQAGSAAREILFPESSVSAHPVRLYYGNQKAQAPHYDFAARLAPEATASPPRLSLGPQQPNPIYRPEPRPLSERSPWLIYLVLSLASIALAAILINLARRAKNMAGQQD